MLADESIERQSANELEAVWSGLHGTADNHSSALHEALLGCLHRRCPSRLLAADQFRPLGREFLERSCSCPISQAMTNANVSLLRTSLAAARNRSLAHSLTWSARSIAAQKQNFALDRLEPNFARARADG
jgi:hypothetical protein